MRIKKNTKERVYKMKLKIKIFIFLGLLFMVCSNAAFTRNTVEYLELNNNGKCYIVLRNDDLTLDFRNHTNRSGLSTNLPGIEEKIENWLEAKGATTKQIQTLHVQHITTDTLDFLTIFSENLKELDLLTSYSGGAIWRVVTNVKFPFLETIDIRGNNVTPAKGALRTALPNLPALRKIIVSNNDIKFIMHKEQGLDAASFIVQDSNDSYTSFEKVECLESMTPPEDESTSLLCTPLVKSKARQFLSLSYWFGTSEANKEN